MSNPVQSVRFNYALFMQDQVLNAREMLHGLSTEIPLAMQRISGSLARHQELLSLIPNLKPTEELLQIRETLEQALPKYSLLLRECGLLKFQTDLLLSSMFISIVSPASLDEATELVRKEGELMQRFDLDEECNQNLLSSLDDSTRILVDEHIHTENEQR